MKKLLVMMGSLALLLAAQCEAPPSPPPIGPEPAPTMPAPGPTQSAIPDPPAPAPAPHPAPSSGDACYNAFANATLLGCPPTAPKSGTWVEACRNATANGIDMRTTCRINARDCPAELGCGK